MIKKTINLGYRTLGVAGGFLLFGLGSICLTCFFLPFLHLIYYRSPQKINNLTRRAVQVCWKLLISYACFLGLMSLNIKNKYLIDSARGQVIVANHPSLIDVVILISILPHSTCIVKDALSKNIFVKDVVSAAYIYNSLDSEKLLMDCAEALNRGDNLVIFPEGTRTVPGQASKVSRGAAQIALFANADILPIRIDCNPLALLKGQKWYNLPQQKIEFTLEAKEPLSISKYKTSLEGRQVIARQITLEVSQILNIQ